MAKDGTVNAGAAGSNPAPPANMPRKRDPLKRLTDDEAWEIELLLCEIRDAYKDWGGEVCECGKIAGMCEACESTRASI